MPLGVVKSLGFLLDRLSKPTQLFGTPYVAHRLTPYVLTSQQ
jgi:hypothetical protein